MPVFDDVNVEKLFGADDAENEDVTRFKEYFYYNQAYSSLVSDLPVRVLVGHKGVGKSALLKRSYLADQEVNTPCIWLRPDAILNVQELVSRENQFIRRIETWKRGILISVLQDYFANRGVDISSLADGKPIDALVSTVLSAILGESDQRLNVYIDDIDRGWAADTDSIRNISALLNAIRDLGGLTRSIRFHIGLRSDVYFLVRTSDESTDKIERNVIWLRWTNDEVLRVMAKRISTFFDMGIDQDRINSLSQPNISKTILSRVIEHEFKGRGHWDGRPIHNVLLSLTRSRPRDLVKLLHLAAKRAYSRQSDLITSTHLEAVFETYSQERLQDIINEYKSEMPDIQNLLLAMRPSKRGRRTSDNFQFSNDELIVKLTNIISQNRLSFTNKRVVSPKSLIQFLYKIDFITARKLISSGEIDRKYFDGGRFLADEFVDFGYSWEIHPAYRWALQPQDINSIFESLLS